MDADANHGCHERRMFFCVYEHAVQAVIIEDSAGGVLVHCGVQIHVLNDNGRHMLFQFMESDKEADRVIALRAGEAHKQRDVLPAYELFFDGFGDFGLCLLGFLLFPFLLVRLFAVSGSREQFVRAYKFVASAAQSLSVNQNKSQEAERIRVQPMNATRTRLFLSLSI